MGPLGPREIPGLLVSVGGGSGAVSGCLRKVLCSSSHHQTVRGHWTFLAFRLGDQRRVSSRCSYAAPNCQEQLQPSPR